MDIQLGQHVACESGDCQAKVTHIVFNPVAEEVAAIVVRQDDAPQAEVVVPAAMIAECSPEKLTLRGSRKELQDCPAFIEQQYLQPDSRNTALSGYLLLPYVLSKILMKHRENTCLSLDQVAVRRGAAVQAADGQAGTIDEFLIDAVNCKLTHLVMRPQKGGRRMVSIPLDIIRHMDKETVRVDLTRAELKRLPRLPIWQPAMPEPTCAAAEHAPLTLPQPETIKKLIMGLTSRSGQKRVEARHRLVDLGTPVIEQLLPLLGHKKSRVRWEAAKTLAQIGDLSCMPGLLTAMDDPFFDIRWVAAEAVAELGRQGLEPLLQELAANPHSAPFRDSAHHVFRSLIQSSERLGLRDELVEQLRAVMLTLEELHPVASLPQVAQQTLELLDSLNRRDENSQRYYKLAYR